MTRTNSSAGAATSPSQAIAQNQPLHQDAQPRKETGQSPLSGLPPPQGQLRISEQPAGWTDVMTGWVRYLLRKGTDLNAIEAGMRSLFPMTNNMVGVQQHLDHIKTEWEGQEVQMQQN